MEKLKGKHNHTLTNILKVFTFAIVLLFPFLVFMPSAFYYGFNEHAQIEIPQKIAIYQTNEVNNLNDIKPFNIYHLETFEINYNSIDDFPIDIYFVHSEQINYSINTYEDGSFNFNQLNGNNAILNLYGEQDSRLGFYLYFGNNYECYFNETCPFISNSYITLTNCDFYFTDDSIEDGISYLNNYTSLPTASTFNVYEISETNSISENLSNSWENMWQTPLFAWTDNTPFTATTNAFASVFNISQQSGIYNLLAYFITITGIYLVIDIVIGVATMLTHMISKQD